MRALRIRREQMWGRADGARRHASSLIGPGGDAARVRMEEHDERLRRVDWAGALIRSLRRHGVRRLEIDLTDVHRAGTDTVAALVLLQKAGSEGGVEVTLRCSEEVERWIEICRLADLLCDDASE